MKTQNPIFNLSSCILLACFWCVGTTTLRSGGAESSSLRPVVIKTADGNAAAADRSHSQDIHVKVFDSTASAGENRKPLTWLGLATEETSEALTSQLGLAEGVGLTVMYVAPESPAAKAGLQKNDVLVEFEGQMLVLPAQLRKLVQVRKEGDSVKLAYYRAGKKESASVTLSKSSDRAELLENQPGWNEAVPRFQKFLNQYSELNGDVYRERLQDLRRSLGDMHIDQQRVQQEVRRSMEEARKAAADALRQSSNNFKRFGPTATTLENLARGWAGISKDATVTVNSTGSSVQTMVKADDSGTCVVVANPRKHLTAHDASGKLLFDGEIETPEQQAAVPKDIWQKVEPMVNKLGADKEKPLEGE